MGNGTFPQLLDRQKYLPSVIGFTVGIIHFAITYMVEYSADYSNRSSVVPIFLITPSLILSIIINSLAFVPKTIYSFVSDTLFIGFSSFFYGMLGGLLISKSRSKRWLGILLLCLLIFSGCSLILLAVQLN